MQFDSRGQVCPGYMQIVPFSQRSPHHRHILHVVLWEADVRQEEGSGYFFKQCCCQHFTVKVELPKMKKIKLFRKAAQSRNLGRGGIELKYLNRQHFPYQHIRCVLTSRFICQINLYHCQSFMTRYTDGVALLTTVGHLKEVILLKLLKHAPFDLNKLQ